MLGFVEGVLAMIVNSVSVLMQALEVREMLIIYEHLLKKENSSVSITFHCFTKYLFVFGLCIYTTCCIMTC